MCQNIYYRRLHLSQVLIWKVLKTDPNNSYLSKRILLVEKDEEGVVAVEVVAEEERRSLIH